MVHEERRDDDSAGSRLLQLAAGAADLAYGGLSSVLRDGRHLLARADVAELAAEGQRELRARGRLVLDRVAAPPPAHLEVLARHAAARRAAGDRDV
ncbi:polyprenyl synthetase [Streptomyces lavendofoliae]|uniref:polyprenyl synthetase n=1 Tax=Streptomyces lavendofoliae TaxID=67314 RepID=UPI003D8D2863